MLSFSLLCFSEKNPKTEISDHMQNHASVKLWTTEIELFEMKFEKKRRQNISFKYLPNCMRHFI